MYESINWAGRALWAHLKKNPREKGFIKTTFVAAEVVCCVLLIWFSVCDYVPVLFFLFLYVLNCFFSISAFWTWKIIVKSKFSFLIEPYNSTVHSIILFLQYQILLCHSSGFDIYVIFQTLYHCNISLFFFFTICISILDLLLQNFLVPCNGSYLHNTSYFLHLTNY